ncbi:aspartyl-phosphate phosphatase Spo0E family protein [Metabacillus bambusae]|uniref:Aspartyl-phosphate phosphatase Spo0E family protein n=1 Tax=Metabacillus bambusae TaxID=2795218 RepID=A0ABS3MW43_9BACI|nr:aspartyl-phosphate phosphatase Spo0E family protein [Metabacillus bambusae]MBO1510239.1 aspartyl-phosphate phosphatase Spo0E family protein [Metabacillus bambusae]
MWEFSFQMLENEIEFTRQNMIFVGMEYGLTHPATIFLSTKLDKLMNDLTMYESHSIHNREIEQYIV